ncbi:MAG: DNA repair protein RecO [Calothrix sp. C42_A2020_038]|nr:DNA repair protein RecO [Calothrix sp. C42_A2020_038]
MSKTYKATGINLKTQVFGESDRLVTILTKEYGLLTAIAPGARKHNSSLGGRSAMFVVNEVLIAKGRSLDKITQANTVKSYPGLAKDLGKLAASQYLAEIVLCQALSENPQEELYELLNEHLARLENVSSNDRLKVMAHLCHAVFQFLALAGFAPQVEACCLTQRPLVPDFNTTLSQVGFSVNAGGIVCLTAWEELRSQNKHKEKTQAPKSTVHEIGGTYVVTSNKKEDSSTDEKYETIYHSQELPTLTKRLNATELFLFQQLSQFDFSNGDAVQGVRDNSWLSVEQVLRQYAQYYFGRSIRSAALVDSYFAANI